MRNYFVQVREIRHCGIDRQLAVQMVEMAMSIKFKQPWAAEFVAFHSNIYYGCQE